MSLYVWTCGKCNSRASYRVQITMAETHTRESAPMAGIHTREPTLQGVNRGSATAEPPRGQRHTPESRRPKASIVASATAEPPIECKSQWQEHIEEPAPQGVNRGSATAEPPFEWKSQWQKHTGSLACVSHCDLQYRRLCCSACHDWRLL